MDGIGGMKDVTSEAALCLQLLWETQQRMQLLGPAASRDSTGPGQVRPCQQLLPTLERRSQPGAVIASGVDWMRRMVAGDRSAPLQNLDATLQPHGLQRQRLPTL